MAFRLKFWLSIDTWAIYAHHNNQTKKLPIFYPIPN